MRNKELRPQKGTNPARAKIEDFLARRGSPRQTSTGERNKLQLSIQSDGSALRVDRYERLAHDWILDGECRYHSPRTRANREILTRNFAWFVRNRCDSDLINASTVRAFMAYLRQEDPEGRWGNPRFTAGLQARSVATYDNHLRTLFAWCVQQGSIRSNPFDKIEKTVSRKSEIEVFSKRDVERLLEVAAESPAARRNIPLVLFMIDTGVRVSELCAMNVGDIDFDNRKAKVKHGKGNKGRTVYFGRATSRALWNYLLDGRRRGDGHAQPPEAPLFRGYRGRHCGERMTRNGVLQIWQDLGHAAAIQVRCSPIPPGIRAARGYSGQGWT